MSYALKNMTFAILVSVGLYIKYVKKALCKTKRDVLTANNLRTVITLKPEKMRARSQLLKMMMFRLNIIQSVV